MTTSTTTLTKSDLASMDGAGFAPPQMHFIKEAQYTTYWVECALDGVDLVYHFFLTEEVKAGQYGPKGRFWMETFAEALSEVAQEVFQASYPRVQATYVSEMESWWMRAHGFADVGDWEARNAILYRKLDEMLERLSH